jgi:hypothetical protein
MNKRTFGWFIVACFCFQFLLGRWEGKRAADHWWQQHSEVWPREPLSPESHTRCQIFVDGNWRYDWPSRNGVCYAADAPTTPIKRYPIEP